MGGQPRSAVPTGLQRWCADPARPTTTKDRFIGRASQRHPQQILRVDREETHPLAAALEAQLIDAVVAQIGHHSAVLVADYAKGACTPPLLERLIAGAAERG